MKHAHPLPRAALALLCTLGLAACGGGGASSTAGPGDGAGPLPEGHAEHASLPANAMADSAAFTAFVAAQAQSERPTPMALGSNTAPSSDSDQPLALN